MKASELRLSVKDSGIGIPSEKLESVFEMFSQLDRSLETGHNGLGIGLALARHAHNQTRRKDQRVQRGAWQG